MQTRVVNETHCQSADRLHVCLSGVVCIQHGIRKRLRVTKPLNILEGRFARRAPSIQISMYFSPQESKQ